MFLAGPPLSPVNVTSFVQQYGRNNVSIILRWDPAVDSGGTSVDNYTVTVTGPTMQELTSLGPTATITVVYNEMYTVNVRASNCVGSSGSATANISEGKDHVFEGMGIFIYFHSVIEITSLLANSLKLACSLVPRPPSTLQEGLGTRLIGMVCVRICIMNWKSHVSLIAC